MRAPDRGRKHRPRFPLQIGGVRKRASRQERFYPGSADCPQVSPPEFAGSEVRLASEAGVRLMDLKPGQAGLSLDLPCLYPERDLRVRGSRLMLPASQRKAARLPCSRLPTS